ncbi:tetratricopeptide repeat protein [Bradyrhizobium ontarionense]|uniref:Tetratricopeptide repeat protein n=2 Tax=Bradyrhizobium ontarionense TaxID=2898149 RepID=A0ABY3R7U2_9BRAD|nr:tetratricopeptide repeat protein [Bradyrhizobium sp. A19]UFZ03087.1 tetratricopeptide repeat protein [Bradyrhizobium sp. A19]
MLTAWCALLAVEAHAIGATEPAKEPVVDASACMAASEARDADKVLTECGALIDNTKVARSDRINALIARASILITKGEADRAIADYDVALQLDPTLADIFNARGELRRKKGDRPRALADFATALRLNPDHASARSNYHALAVELERLGAQMAVAGRPSFNCATVRRAVEKAICADPELANLDREIDGSQARVVREAGSAAAARGLQREQDAFIARRNAEFGRAGYDLKKAMQDRLRRLNGADGY